jgi:molecular chaperone GrpE
MSHDSDRPHGSKDLDPSDVDGARSPEVVGDAQLAELTDRHLRLAAEYDNFRKRTGKERTELWGKAQAALLGRLVDALDDLSRFAGVDATRTDAKTLHEGINLVERKFWKELEAVGVLRMDQVGVVFDPNLHEAVTTAPAANPAQDHTVGAVLQAGYKLGDVLIRPARVQVLTWQGDAGRGTGKVNGSATGLLSDLGVSETATTDEIKKGVSAARRSSIPIAT